VNGTSLASARTIAARGTTPLVLNFASAKNPGGGFLNGARAQEESLARSSALYPCLRKSGMYDHHRASGDCLYTDWMIVSPEVPVYRDDETGALLGEAFGAELEGAYAGVFDEVVFAVLDWSDERRFIRPFVERFAS
jgi:uncharacterized protein (TIGR02452 family)